MNVFICFASLIALSIAENVDTYKLEKLAQTVKQINETLTKENEMLRQENARLNEEMKEFKDMVMKEPHIALLDKRAPPTHPVVAFDVALTANLVLTRDGQNARYDRVITNIGGGYNYNSGRFTAPVRGIYLFTATTVSLSENDYVQMNIVKNGKEVAYSWSHRTGTTTSLLELQIGDWVEYQRFTGIMTQPYTLRGADQSSFAGVLISQL